MAPVQRWDGHAREARDWNELRRDPELFFANGNTLIYLYSRGRSQRGPSFRIPYEFLLYSGCRPLVEQSLISTLASSPYDDQEYSKKPDESYLYLHAPQHLSREESFAYHVTTRNFFAWLMGVPIVGRDPISALLALKDRMEVWRDEGSDNLVATCAYIHEQGYGDAAQLQAQLPPVPTPTMYRDRSSRYGGAPTLKSPAAKRSGSVAAARQSLRRTMHLSGKIHRHPHIADLIRPQKKDHLSIRIPLREGELATIGYEDTSAGTPPSTTAWQPTPKPKHAQSICRNSNYTEIVIPDYGNGLHDLSPTLESTSTSTTTTSPSAPSIPQTSPSDAYTRRPSQNSSSDNDTPQPPSPSSSSSSSSSDSSRHSAVPSLSSTYSIEEGESPTTLTTPQLATDPFNHDNDNDGTAAKHAGTTASLGLESHPPSAAGGADGGHVKILGSSAAAALGGGEPDGIIDALIGELEAAGLGGKPRYGEGLGMERYVVLSPGRGERGGVGLLA